MSGGGRSAVRWVWIAILAWVVIGADPYTAPDGDLNRDGVVDAVDLQCEVLLFDALQGAAELTEDACAVDGDCPESYACRVGPTSFKLCFPVCLSSEVTFGQANGPVCTDPEEDSPECLGIVGKMNADMNCDDEFSNVDFQFVVALVMGKAGGAGTADVDGDGQLNFCDADSDADEILALTIALRWTRRSGSASTATRVPRICVKMVAACIRRRRGRFAMTSWFAPMVMPASTGPVSVCPTPVTTRMSALMMPVLATAAVIS